MTDNQNPARQTNLVGSEPFAYAHPLGAIWRLDNYPAGMDFTKDGWFPLYRSAPQMSDVVAVHDGGNAITLFFSEILSAKGFRSSFPTHLVSAAPDLVGENKRLRLELAATIRDGISAVADAKEATSPQTREVGSEDHCERLQICPDIALGTPCRGPCAEPKERPTS
jgi:hypothetical protein